MAYPKWLVIVSENGKHAYNESFWTRKKALEFIDRTSKYGIKWSFELRKLGATK